MKKIYLSIVAAVSLMFVSCTADWLNTDPSTAVPSDDAIIEWYIPISIRT